MSKYSKKLFFNLTVSTSFLALHQFPNPYRRPIAPFPGKPVLFYSFKKSGYEEN